MLQWTITHCSGRFVPLHPMGILIHSPQSLRVHIDKLMSVWVNEFIQRWRSIYALLLCDAALLGVIILYWIFFIDFSADVSITISRQYGTYGDVEVFYRTLLPNETNLPYLPAVQARADASDFRYMQGSVIFSQGQRSASFSVLVMDDTIPETDESVFVMLSKVQLLRQAQSRPCEYHFVNVLHYRYIFIFCNKASITVYL